MQKKVLKLTSDKLASLDPLMVTAAVEQAAAAEGADIILFAHDFTGKVVAPRLAARLKAGMIAGATELATASGDSLTVRKNVFSGKASALCSINSAKKVITVLPGAFAAE